MKITDLIKKKKLGEELSTEEIRFFVKGVSDGTIPEYQTSALLMAIWFQGMNREETFDLTIAMRDSGDTLDLSEFPDTIDKHSTGGIGDKLSLIVLPFWLASGLTVAKMSGRGLGFTGGTIDKLESVPGYQTSLDRDTFFEHIRRFGVAVAGQSESLVPADKKLYALRDVTETVDSLPLIAASIMSKKLATAASTIVLDVKYGEGSFMKTRKNAKKLAEIMVEIGKNDGRRMGALLSPMDRPLGRAVGNALEIKEAHRFLKGEAEGDLKENAFALIAAGFVLGGKADDLERGRQLAAELLENGKARQSFYHWLRAQGGCFDKDNFEEAVSYPAAEYPVYAEKDGYITAIHGLNIGIAAMELGAGRKKLGDAIDPAAGVVLQKDIGDRVRSGDILAVLYGNGDFAAAAEIVQKSVIIEDGAPQEANDEIEIFNGDRWEYFEKDHD